MQSSISKVPVGHINILESILHGIIVTDLQGHIIYSNPVSTKVFGYSKSESQGMSIRTLYDEDRKMPFREILSQIAKESPVHLCWHGLRKNGSRVWLDIRVNMVNGSDGQADSCVISLHVIDDLKQTEKKLEENRAFAETVLETSVDAIISIDEHGDILSFNRAATKMFGYNEQEVIGRRVDMLLAATQNKKINYYLQEIQKPAGKNISVNGFNTEAQKKDGNVFPVELSISEVTWGGSKIYTAIVKDLTRRRELERRIIEIGNEERRRIGRELHDGLGQMLTGIRLLSETMAMKLEANGVPGSDNVREIANMIRDADEQARDLAHGIVGHDLESKGFSHTIQSLCEKTQKATGINCTFTKDGDFEIKDFNIALHLLRIIQEAVNNAVKHAMADNIHVKVKRNPHISVIIEDDGVGFDFDDEQNHGAGIQIMNFRTELLEGHFELSRVDGSRTRILCEFPTLQQK